MRAMIDSAHGLDPKDMSEAAKAKRNLPSAGAEGIAAACFQYGHCPTAIDKSRSR
jgi:hypothetical protein